jgi:DNA-binding transcriptional LysR family regulator
VIRGGALADTTLIARKLCEMDFVTCCHASYIERHGRPSHPSEIEQHHAIVGYFSSLTGKVFPLRFARDEQLEISARTAVGERKHGPPDRADHRHGHRPDLRFVKDAIARGEMVTLLEDWQPPRHPLYVMYPPNRHLNATVRVFVDWAVQLFATVDNRA